MVDMFLARRGEIKGLMGREHDTVKCQHEPV